MTNFDLQRDFIDYWDNVIKAWFKCANFESLDPDKINGLTCQKEKEAIDEQKNVIEAINNKNSNKDYKLITMHMPEPYWGNPNNCSIVLLDYNPAGSWRVSRHTTINCKDCSCFGNGKNTVIKYVLF